MLFELKFRLVCLLLTCCFFELSCVLVFARSFFVAGCRGAFAGCSLSNGRWPKVHLLAVHISTYSRSFAKVFVRLVVHLLLHGRTTLTTGSFQHSSFIMSSFFTSFCATFLRPTVSTAVSTMLPSFESELERLAAVRTVR